jgi:GxxExxY protein
MISQHLINQLSFKVIGCAIEVHRQLGPGLLESVYHACLLEELKTETIPVQSQLYVPVVYKGKDLGGQLRLDFLVDNLLVIEIKAVDIMIPLYQAQLLSYLKLTGKPKGLLINFHCENLSKQVISLVTEDFAKLPLK